MLKRLQFLFKLPNQLKSLVSNNNFQKVSTLDNSVPQFGKIIYDHSFQAVEDYKQAEQILIHYGDLESFTGIRHDCEATIEELRQKLHQQLNSSEVILLSEICIYQLCCIFHVKPFSS